MRLPLPHFFKKKGSATRMEKKPSGMRWWRDRMFIIRVVVILIAVGFSFRLFSLQVLSYDAYRQAADGGHRLYEKLVPKRGEIFLRERVSSGKDDPLAAEVSGERLFPAVTNREYNLVYAVPNVISDPDKVADEIAPLLGIDREEIKAKLDKPGDMYEVLARKVSDDVVAQIKERDLIGIYFSTETGRFYPEKGLGGQLFGFIGYVGDQLKGVYGLEGYFDSILQGKEGSLQLETDPTGAFIPIGNRKIVEAVDGSSLILTVDRVIQTVTCNRLKAWVAQHNADGGSVVIMEPQTGAVLAMCSTPDYEPDNRVGSALQHFQNPAIFTPYEPGSIFKPLTVAIGIDTGQITPSSTYVDTGEVKVGPYTIRNSDLKAHGVQTMTDVLDNSLNTGTIFIAAKVGLDRFRDYVKSFGFGALTGIEMNTEAAGTIASLNQKQDVYLYTASFGQGLTVTPLQITNAFGALANGGVLMQPYIVDAILKPDGTKVKTEPKALRRVVSERTAALVNGMMVTVVRKGHGTKAGVPYYYVAGKTGTAQVARTDGRGYESNATIGSFIGFAPVEKPRFVMLVKIDRPRAVTWAESSAAPLFGDLAKFLLNYMEVPPDEEVPDNQ